MDLLAVNALGYLRHAGTTPTSHASFLDHRAHDFYPDWDMFADVAVSIPRTEAGATPQQGASRPHRRALHSQRRVPPSLGAHNVRHHGTGFMTFHQRVVGDLTLAYEGVEMAAEPVTLTCNTAELGSASTERLILLASWEPADTETGITTSTRAASTLGTKLLLTLARGKPPSPGERVSCRVGWMRVCRCPRRRAREAEGSALLMR